jgi:hypothetical protein
MPSKRTTAQGQATAERMAGRWTFETLAQADKPTLEAVLLTGTAPDFEQTEGYIYCGWNHEWVAVLSGRKFKKGFRKKDGRYFGYNETVHQDGQGYGGEWAVKTRDGHPHQLGFFRVSLVRDEPPERLSEPYRHLGHFNYDVEMDTGLNRPFRVIRDFVVVPNPGDHTLMLCKAYFQLGFKWLNLFYCYFLLGRREPIVFEPPWSR